MSLARKTQAKYGAKIPTARSTGAKQAQPEKQATPTEMPAKPAPKVTKVTKGGDKKR